MTLNSPMFLTAYKADGYDTAGMSTFYLPFRDSSQDEFNLVTQGDCFLTVTNNSENPEVAKAFLEFYFSEAWYPDYNCLHQQRQHHDSLCQGAGSCASDCIRTSARG